MRDGIRRVVIFHFVLQLYIFFFIICGGYICFFFFFWFVVQFLFLLLCSFAQVGVCVLFVSKYINSINKIKETN